ncbi:MAG: hypothetical protein Q9211_002279 [Gyalolechia sp. 1 TL-2023]
MDPAPPAWLRSYKAHSSIIPNYASKVRPETDDSITAHVPANKSPSNAENEKASEYDDAMDQATNPFTFPSAISLTLHNAGSLDTSYTNSTSTPSPSKTSFGRRYEEDLMAGEKVPAPDGKLSNQRRGPFCRFLAAIRVVLRSKTQNTLAY